MTISRSDVSGASDARADDDALGTKLMTWDLVFAAFRRADSDSQRPQVERPSLLLCARRGIRAPQDQVHSRPASGGPHEGRSRIFEGYSRSPGSARAQGQLRRPAPGPWPGLSTLSADLAAESDTPQGSWTAMPAR